MNSTIRIGTRESALAIWQATLVKDMLFEKGYSSTLVYIKSEGDIDLKTPLYEMGVQGIFTRSLDIALLNNTIDIAVHSMKDVPTQLPAGIVQGAVLERGNYRDLFVPKSEWSIVNSESQELSSGSETFYNSLESSAVSPFSIHHSLRSTVATSSIRRKAQWLHRYPNSIMENLRGNVNTRLKKLYESNWDGAIFAAAGLERIDLKPENSIELDWMLPAPAQGAIMVVCREFKDIVEALAKLDHEPTATCTMIERDFLRALLGGCSTPISALAQVNKDEIYFRGNILSTDGKQKTEIERSINKTAAKGFGKQMAIELLKNGGQEIADLFRNAK